MTPLTIAIFAIFIVLVVLGIGIMSGKNGSVKLKRLFLAITAVGVILMLIFFGIFRYFRYQEELPAHSLGFYKEKHVYTHGEFQDYTDFGVYTYKKVKLEDNPYFSKITSGDLREIGQYIDNYEEWVRLFGDNDPEDKLVLNYTFDRSVLDTNDYFYLEADNEHNMFGNYDLWILDSQTLKLYYFHHNI